MRLKRGSKSGGKNKHDQGGGLAWFETAVNGGVHILRILSEAASKTPTPLAPAATAVLTIIRTSEVIFLPQYRYVDFVIDNAFRTLNTTKLIFDD